jgi:hypothetical protein
MTWFAKEDIDSFKAGDVVPAAKAEVWAQMYKVSPVEFRKEVTPAVVPAAVVKDTLFAKEEKEVKKTRK